MSWKKKRKEVKKEYSGIKIRLDMRRQKWATHVSEERCVDLLN